MESWGKSLKSEKKPIIPLFHDSNMPVDPHKLWDPIDRLLYE